MDWKETLRGWLTLSFLKKAPQEPPYHNLTLPEIKAQLAAEKAAGIPPAVPAIPVNRDRLVSAVGSVVSHNRLDRTMTGSAAGAGWIHVARIIDEAWTGHPLGQERHTLLHNAMIDIGNALAAARPGDQQIYLPASSMADLIKYWGEIHRTIELLKAKPLMPADLPSGIEPFRRSAQQQYAKDFPRLSPVSDQIQDLTLINAGVRRLFLPEFAAHRGGNHHPQL